MEWTWLCNRATKMPLYIYLQEAIIFFPASPQSEFFSRTKTSFSNTTSPRPRAGGWVHCLNRQEIKNAGEPAIQAAKRYHRQKSRILPTAHEADELQHHD